MYAGINYMDRSLALPYSCKPCFSPIIAPTIADMPKNIKEAIVIFLKIAHIPIGSARVARAIRKINAKSKNRLIKNIFAPFVSLFYHKGVANGKQ